MFEQSLALSWQQNSIVMLGKRITLPRQEYMVGDSPDMAYIYSGSVELRSQPWPPFLQELRSKIEQTGYEFQVAIGNLYRDGSDSIGYHADDQPSMGHRPAIASISLGATRTFRVKSKEVGSRSVAYSLGHGDLLIMHPGCQDSFVHSIPKTKQLCGTRINWTFRPYLIH